MTLKDLIQQHKTAAEEIWSSLEEINKIDRDKLSKGEIQDLRVAINRLEAEYDMRLVFISELEDLE